MSSSRVRHFGQIMLDHLVIRQGSEEKAVEIRIVVLAVVHIVVELNGYLRRYRAWPSLQDAELRSLDVELNEVELLNLKLRRYPL